MATVVNIGYIQMACSADKAANINQTALQVRALAARGAQIICLQELFATRYFCHTQDHSFFSLADTAASPAISLFGDLAAELGVVIIVPFFERRASGLYHNSAVVFDADGTDLGVYRKAHIPDDPGFNEKFYFAPGDTGYKVFKTRYARIGVLICWDQWYPEAARINALMGAELLIYPTAIGWDLNELETRVNSEQLNAWKTIQQAHAIANGIFVVSVNRCGVEEGTRFWGNSFVCNPFGTMLNVSGTDNEDAPVVKVDLEVMERYRTVWPFLRDRRIETYQPLLNRFLD